MQEPLGTRTAFQGHAIRVDVEDWPGLPPYDVVRHPGAAAVLPLTPVGDVLLVKQFRPAVRQELTEIPAGLLDVDGEDALACAARELFEETGYRHQTIEFLGGYYSSAGFTDEVRPPVLGQDVRRARSRAGIGDPDRGAAVRRDGDSGARGTDPRREDGPRAAPRGWATTAPVNGRLRLE